MARTMAPCHRRWLAEVNPVSSFSISLILSIFIYLPSRFVYSRKVFFFPQLRLLLSYPFLRGAARKPLEKWRERPSGWEKCCLGNSVLGSYDVGKKTLLGLLLSVRKKDRSYLQATLANGRRRAKIPLEGTRQTSLRDASPIPLLAILPFSFLLFLSIYAIFILTLPRKTTIQHTRRSYIARHTI